MRTFECDYTEGVHPKILSALTETNMEQMSGYGFDPYTARAAEKIKAACNAPDATVTFLVGGTQTSSPVTRCLRLRSTTACWTSTRSKHISKRFMRTRRTSTWCVRVSSI